MKHKRIEAGDILSIKMWAGVLYVHCVHCNDAAGKTW